MTLSGTGTGDVVAVDPHDRLTAGTMVGEYQIEMPIGEGGMGVVYGAVHPLIGKRAAIKVLHPSLSVDRESVARFIQEAQAVNKIGHANIVDIFAFGTLRDGRAYFVMEWLQGRTLEERIKQSTLPISDAATIMLALVRALEAAHAAGVIHRDLKPENVFLVADGDSFRVKLLDFGIAKLSSAQHSTSRTATGLTVGTPLYMSPEQARGVDLDARTDLYSLGVVAYEMLCGGTPFGGEASAVEVLHAHISKPPRSPRELRPDVPAAFEAMILALLAKRPDDRPTLLDVRRQLGAFATRSSPIAIPAEAVPTIARTLESRRLNMSAPFASDPSVEDDLAQLKRRTGPLLAGGIVAALVGIVALIAWRNGSSADAADAVTLVGGEIRGPVPAPAPTPSPPHSLPAPAPGMPATALLKPAPVAVVNLAIEPQAAVVTIDGKPVVVDRGDVHAELEPGVHTVSVRAPGYRAFDQKVDAVADKATHLTIRLVRVRTAPARTTPDQREVPDTDGVVNPFRQREDARK